MTPTEDLERLAESITPGPWKHFMGDICADFHGDDTLICGMNKSYGARSSEYFSYKANNPTAQANASAIAMLPELLAEVIATRRASGQATSESAEPAAWVIPGDDNANCNGFIDAMAWQEGEFSRPLYAHPQPPTVEAAARVERAFDEIRELNMSGRDGNGHRWANSDLIDQSVTEGLIALRTLAAKGGQHE